MSESAASDSTSFRVSSARESLVVSSEFEGANAARAAAVATWAIGSRETVARLREPLIELGFSERMLERQASARDVSVEELERSRLGRDLDEARVQRWEQLATSAQLRDAVLYLIELLRSPLERESATAAAALWRILNEDARFAAPRLIGGLTGVFHPVSPDDASELVDWSDVQWADHCASWGTALDLWWVQMLVEERLHLGLRSSDKLTQQIAMAAFLSRDPGSPPPTSSQSNREPGHAQMSTIVHGTWGWVGDWWQAGGDFFDYMKARHRPDLYDQGMEFGWDGFCRASHRAKASTRFARWATTAAPGGLRTVFAHSYGGEVVARAVNAAQPVEELVLLSVPVTPSVAAVCTRTRVVDIRLSFDIVLGLTGYGQRLATHENVTEVILSGWNWQHGASHDDATWQHQGVAMQAGL
ncbi:hypothetical protein KUM42_08410 [Modestobacter sp. L9-4]|uniref:hypothetical protein n=1 Tax=Modestobacter sp. L9-4 TaxID=2851567 RepID=UPI001C760A44|nr:hypothetical protein [Modestobacter sp. L9-4]QXG77507.1 hypothetical protein KUM42_08410 [Modestobacter sp. L9-4]